MRGILALIVTFIISAQLFGAIVHDTLYINRGMLTPLVGVDFAFFAYNDSPVFNPENERIHIEQGDSLYLTVINNDTIVHGTAVSETSATPVILNAGVCISQILGWLLYMINPTILANFSWG